jgi:hypothetical protein
MDIFVTNKNDFDHTDRFNGKDYVFPKGESVPVPIEAARHMFGFNSPDKTDNLLRLGWEDRDVKLAVQGRKAGDGIRWLANFVFSEAKLVEVAPIEAEVVTPKADIPVFGQTTGMRVRSSRPPA